MQPSIKSNVSSLVHADALQLPDLAGLRVLVAGEVILDRYVYGEVERISPEAPIPVLRVSRREEKVGNAGFVMASLRALGALPAALSVVGADRTGALLLTMLRENGITTTGLLSDPMRPTIMKERLLGSVQSANRATQQLLRVDEEETTPLNPAIEAELISCLDAEFAGTAGVLVSDINKGVLTPLLLRCLLDGARAHRIPAIVDPRLTNDFSIYRGATALTPNRFETEIATGMRLVDESAWHAAAHTLIERLDLDACLITLDRDGMYLAERGGAGRHIPTTPRDVYDVTGAGDVVLSVFGGCVIAGLEPSAAAALANLAAGLEVSRLGAEVISRDQLARALEPDPAADDRLYQRKLVDASELISCLDDARRAGRRIVFTNGCFDLLHAGHLRLLGFARSHGDLLVVGLNSDSSVRQLKGPARPIYCESDRARLLAALELVDYVVIFSQTRADDLIRLVKPDVLVKGADWNGRRLDGAEFVEAYGGRVILAPMVPDHSTTLSLSRIRAAEKSEVDAAAVS